MQVSYNVDASFYIADLSDYNVCNAEEKLAIEKAAGMYTSTAVNSQVTLDNGIMRNWPISSGDTIRIGLTSRWTRWP